MMFNGTLAIPLHKWLVVTLIAAAGVFGLEQAVPPSDPWGLGPHIGLVIAVAGFFGMMAMKLFTKLTTQKEKGVDAREAGQDERAAALAKSENDKAAALAQSNTDKAAALAAVLDRRFGDLATQLTNLATIIEKSAASFDSRFERLQDITTANVTAVAVLVERARRQDAEADKPRRRTRAD